MELTAKDATILSLLTAHPSTRFFQALVERLDDPRAKELAQKIRDRAGSNGCVGPQPDDRLSAQQ
jgi:hypothetical protein